MSQIIVGMLAETFIHPGIGQANSAIDLPVARERTTDYPFIPGSSIKGGYKSWGIEQAGLVGDKDLLFGKNDDAGAILFSDARLVLLPVRSLNTAYVWLTCPILLERLERDIRRIGENPNFSSEQIKVADDQTESRYFSEADFGRLALEEREFIRQGNIPASEKKGLLDAFSKLAPAVGRRIENQIAIVSDDEFAWFAKNALPVSAHNNLDEETKASNFLWYEEALPPDTVMYSLLAERKNKTGALAKIETSIGKAPYAQFGGNETLGQGWFQMKVAFTSPVKVAASVQEAAHA